MNKNLLQRARPYPGACWLLLSVQKSTALKFLSGGGGGGSGGLRNGGTDVAGAGADADADAAVEVDGLLLLASS